jgi:hypothetical protein
MSIKLVILKSGEDVVADVEEMVINDKVVGYFFNHPCRVKLTSKGPQRDGSHHSPFKIDILPWSPLSKDQRIPVVVDWVISMMEPIDELRRMYEKVVLDYERRKSAAVVDDKQSVDTDSD